MSVSSFLSSFADKAQSAINQTPLAGHVPGITNATDQPSANQSAAQGGHRSVALEALQHQIRSIGQQYTTTTPVQRIITSEKGVAIDCDALARDAKVQSKELYTWGQTQQEDLKDVTDRLAYLNFVQGSLASSVAIKLNNARAPFKALRDAEAVLAPKRNFRTGLRTQISRIEHSQDKSMERKLPELKQTLAKAELVDEPLEKELEILKRKAVRESEAQKWDAIREVNHFFGEKLILLSQASKPIIAVLPPIPPSSSSPYTGAQETGAARAALQHALDNYTPGSTYFAARPDANLSRADTQSFGESHASELHSIASSPGGSAGHPGVPITPPPQASYASDAEKSRDASRSPPIDPRALNLSPAPIPDDQTPPIATVTDRGSLSPVVIAATAPTVAETGVPVPASATGPGPASGSLRDIHRASDAAGPRSGGFPGNSPSDDLYGQPHETAEEEKSRLEREERERVSAAGTSGPPATSEHESAEEEKRRLEREERERVLAIAGWH
ncbi:Eisosome component PIL1-domain-containing protein [Suillus subluteus]|nr:Eisosome component PIL1-domain-containing protein [Suillus subluteus]